MIQFKDITFDDMAMIKKCLEQNTNKACEFSLANVYMWNVDNMCKYSVYQDQLVYRCVNDACVTYSVPNIGPDSKPFLDDLLLDAKQLNKQFTMKGLSEEMMTQMELFYPNLFEYSFNRDNSDYIYKVEELAELRGKKYHGKKNHINYFLKNYTYEYEEISAGNITECHVVKDDWSEQKDSDSASVETELGAVDLALNHFEELGLTGGLIRIDGVVKAFTIGERLTQDTFVTHIEKADTEVRGLYPMINWQFAIHALGNYTYVNREEDLGVEGLRKAKLSYQPEMIWNKYRAVLKA